jgi:hypothetical protein
VSAAGARVSRRELGEALLWALLLALLFLRAGVLPTRAVLPFVPEVYEPLRSEALADGSITPAELDRGNRTMGDKFNQSLAWDRILQTRLRAGEPPLWTRDIAGGAPFVPQMAQVWQPWNLLLAWLPIPSCGIYGIWLLGHLVLLGLGAYWFLRGLGLAHAAALVGLVAVELGFWTQARVHHNVILTAALPLFPLLCLVDEAWRGRGLGPGRVAAFGLGIGLSWSAGFAPVSLQLTLLVGGYATWRAVSHRDLRPTLRLGAGFALGALLASPQMGPVLQAAGITARPPASAASLAANGLAAPQLASLVFPDLLQWPAARMHGGETGPAWVALECLADRDAPDLLEVDRRARTANWPETAFAIGIPGLLCALLALAQATRRAAFFGAVLVLAIGLAMARTPFLELSGWIPGARAGDLRRFLFLASMAIAVLAALGAELVLRARRAHALGALALLVAAVSAVPLVELLRIDGDLEAFRTLWAKRLAGPRAGIVVDEAMVRAAMELRPFEAANNLAAQTATAWRALLVALGAALAAFGLRGGARVRVLAALAALELLHAGAGIVVPVPTERVERVPAILAPLVAETAAATAKEAPRPRFQRLEPGPHDRPQLLPVNLGAYHGFEDLGAYNPLPPARMEQFFDALEPRAAGAIGASIGGAGVGALKRSESLTHPLLDLLGCRYVLAPRALVPASPTLVDRTPADSAGAFALVERTSALPRATFCDRIERIAEPAARLARLAERDRDLRATLILEAEGEVRDPGGDGIADAELRIVRHRDEEVLVAVTNREPGYLRLADPYDPDWTAQVDGRNEPILVADHYLRAVWLEPGTHEVVFRYTGPVVTRSLALGLLGATLSALLLLIAARRRVRARRALAEVA